MIHQLLIAAMVEIALAAPPSSKIAPDLVQVFKSRAGAKVNIFIDMKESNDNVLARVDAGRYSSRTGKINMMKAQLEGLARTSKQEVLMLIKAQDVKFRSFWITNQLFVREATEELVHLIAADSQVSMIKAEEHFNIVEPTENSINAAEWGIEKVEAELAWALPGGNSGQGVVVSTIDTGVRYTHEALHNNYRDDGYSWYDPYDASSNPIDQDGHGTHTMGTIVGSGGIGVAPGALWIACRGCHTSTSCTQYALTACGEWSVCPTRADGSGADCSKAPGLSSNSWEGAPGSTSFLAVVNAWHSAGIIPIFGVGTSGPYCGSAKSPGDLTNVIGVGSTDLTDKISFFSSRGAAVQGHLKPDISAPGGNVRSSWFTRDAAYNTISETSMATSHVAGATALLLAANPNLSYHQVYAALTENTDTLLHGAATCGGTPYDQWPNNIYGYGRLNARKALISIIGGLPI